jgi:hypothetical protein
MSRVSRLSVKASNNNSSTSFTCYARFVLYEHVARQFSRLRSSEHAQEVTGRSLRTQFLEYDGCRPCNSDNRMLHPTCESIQQGISRLLEPHGESGGLCQRPDNVLFDIALHRTKYQRREICIVPA